MLHVSAHSAHSRNPNTPHVSRQQGTVRPVRARQEPSPSLTTWQEFVARQDLGHRVLQEAALLLGPKGPNGLTALSLSLLLLASRLKAHPEAACPGQSPGHWWQVVEERRVWPRAQGSVRDATSDYDATPKLRRNCAATWGAPASKPSTRSTFATKLA